MLRPCLECGEPTKQSRCPVHTSARNKARGSSTQRGYGATWQRVRDGYIARNPLCQEPGCSAFAVDVDHVVPIRAGGTHKHANLQSLCRLHHARKTQADKARYPG